MNAKTYYQNYVADDSLSELSERLMAETMRFVPVHVLDFGCGTGKHSFILNELGVSTIGIDISFLNIIKAKSKYDLPHLVIGDEGILRHMINIDVIITCSVMDHIEDVSGIIEEFKRIANKGVLLAETNSFEGNFYFRHDYESYGFEKLDYKWNSDGDGGTYHIWKWIK